MIYAAVAKHIAAARPELTFDATGATGNVFVLTMPSSPDVAVAVMAGAHRPQRTNAPTDLPAVQLIVRGDEDPRTALAEADALYGLLAGLDGVTLDEGGPDAVFVHGSTPVQSAPVAMGLDPNRRHEFAVNFDLSIHNPTANRPAA